MLIFLSAGAVPGLINQIVLRFSEEEFYTALMVLYLSVFWSVLWLAFKIFLSPLKYKTNPQKDLSKTGGRILLVTNLLIFGAIIVFALIKYQDGFFPSEPQELYSGISQQNPILCEELSGNGEETVVSLDEVQEKYASAIINKPKLETLDYGYLAAYYQQEPYFSQFREAILNDANQMLYTQPAGSIKWDQLLAAQTLYYYLVVSEIKPDFLTNSQATLINQWVEEINKRAQTAEWVDWMYGTAFSHKPVGAYLNQDIGAGLYAILNQLPVTTIESRDENAQFLDENLRGWQAAFRVTDDALSYQPVWITNSYFQAMLSDLEVNSNTALSFEWILAQALPDAGLQTYNFPGKTTIAPISLFGATLLKDPTLLWLANRGFETIGQDYNYYVQVGTERVIADELIAEEPDIGSCLIYGNSGLPENPGPLSPDKIVFREGWDEDDLYIMLNLRFTGWHRYKASNAISLIYAGQPLVEEQYTQELIPWLPIGRAIVRDKRIPLEQLNTLLIERSGLDAVLNTLNGWFGPYSQDPPYYADVEEFFTSEALDYSKTTIKDWHGWDFSREISLLNDGLAVVVDKADHRGVKSANIRWHMSGDFELNGENRFDSPTKDASLILLSQSGGGISSNRNDGLLVVDYQSLGTGNLDLVTVILSGELSTAELVEFSNGRLILNQNGKLIEYDITPQP